MEKKQELMNPGEAFLVEDINEKRLAMSNVLISSKYAASLMELKITYLALQSIQLGDYVSKGDNIYVSWPGTKIRKALGGMSNNNFFYKLNEVCEHMMGRTIGIVDPERHSFCYIPFITMAKYNENGDRKLVIRFAPEMENFILNLDKNFTLLLKDTMMGFRSEYSFKLYEVLKSYAYYPKDYKKLKNGKFQIEMSLSELKLMMGIVNAEMDSVKDVLNRTRQNPDYDKAVEVAPEKKYQNYKNFRIRVLEPAIKEINATTDIRVKFDPVKMGRGGKVTGIIFTIQDLKYVKEPDPVIEEINIKKNNKLSEKDKFILISETIKALQRFCDIGYDEAIILLEKSDNNIEVIKEKAEILNEQKIDADFNVMGFMIKAIEGDWKPSPKAKEGSGKTNSRHFDYERQYTNEQWKELENRLRKN